MKSLLFLLLNIYLLNAQIVIVTNKNSQINSIPKELVQYVYLGKIDKLKGTKVKALLSDDETLHQDFCKEILCKSQSQYNSYWARLVFTGKKPIHKKLEFKEIVQKLQELNTIAYIKREDLKSEWKVIYEQD